MNLKQNILIKYAQISVNLIGVNPNLISNTGILLLQKIENKLNLIKKIASVIKEFRVKNKCKHDVLSMIKQRVFSIALGNEDLNDQIYLRYNSLLKYTVNSNKDLASCPTISRFERIIDWKEIFESYNILVENFINSYIFAPKEIILDFDGIETKVYGRKEGAKYNGFYKHKCYLPLFVFCGKHLLLIRAIYR